MLAAQRPRVSCDVVRVSLPNGSRTQLTLSPGIVPAAFPQWLKKEVLKWQRRHPDDVRLTFLSGIAIINETQLFDMACNANTLTVVLTTRADIDALDAFHAGAGSFAGQGVLSPNGSCYWAPFNRAAILRVTPHGDEEMIDVPPNFRAMEAYKAGGVRSESGDMYFAPYNADAILRITPDGNPLFINLKEGWHKGYEATGCLGRNGIIYFPPGRYSTTMLCIGGPTDIAYMSLRDVLDPNGRRHHGRWPSFKAPGVMTCDGTIYFPQSCGRGILCIGVDGDTSFLPYPDESMQDFRGRGVVTADGFVYFAPFQTFNVLCVTPERTVRLLTPMNADPWHGSDPDFAYLADGVLDGDGNALFAPYYGNAFLRCCAGTCRLELLTFDDLQCVASISFGGGHNAFVFPDMNGNVVLYELGPDGDLWSSTVAICPPHDRRRDYARGVVIGIDSIAYLAPCEARQTLRIVFPVPRG